MWYCAESSKSWQFIRILEFSWFYRWMFRFALLHQLFFFLDALFFQPRDGHMFAMGQKKTGRDDRHEGHQPQHDAATGGQRQVEAEDAVQDADGCGLRSAAYYGQLK